VVGKVRVRWAVSKRTVKKMDIQRLILKESNAEEVKEQDQVTIRNESAALENSEVNGDINEAWDATENIKFCAKESIGYCE
jgi:hypothetical protein